MKVFGLYIYPLKAARAVTLERADVLAAGLRHDRRFMALDARGRFITQRSHPRMALLDVGLEGDHMQLSVGGGDHASVPLLYPDLAHRPHRHATVWNDEVEAIDVGGEGAELISDHLREHCSLVFMPPEAIRLVEAPYGEHGDRVGFADAYPVLIASLASLADLNGRLADHGATSVGIDRFRANIIVEGGKPYAEEEAARCRVGAVVFRTPKRCSRCQVVTVDQHTGDRGKEPLRTLASYRTHENKVSFAMNAIPELRLDEPASVAIHDDVSYLPAPSSGDA